MNIKNYVLLFIAALLIFTVIIFFCNKKYYDKINEITIEDKLVDTNVIDNANDIEKNLINHDFLSLKNKKNREQLLVDKATESKKILNEKNLYLKLVEKGVQVDNDLAGRMKLGQMTDKDFEWLQVQIASIMSEEENFAVEMSGVRNFKEIKSAYDERSKETGLYYGNEILNNSGVYRDASSEEIIEIIKNGATIPQDAMVSMILSERLDLAVELTTAGFPVDVSFYDDIATVGLMEIQIQFISWDPTRIPIEKQLKYIDRLKDMGVPLKDNDGTRDALDRALEYSLATTDSDSAERLMIVAKKLNEIGISVEASHKELLASLHAKHPDLYDKYLSEFH